MTMNYSVFESEHEGPLKSTHEQRLHNCI